MKPTNCSRRRMAYVLIGLGVGVLFTLPALLLAFISAGGGHGDYLWVNVFFPYSMILRLWHGSHLNVPFVLLVILLACVQFPVYGGLIGAFASSLKKAAAVAAIIGIVHVVAVTACFITVASHEAERAAAHAAFNEKYDTDGDGKLSPEERRAASAAARAAAHAEFLKKYDTDGDGKLSPEERRAGLFD